MPGRRSPPRLLAATAAAAASALLAAALLLLADDASIPPPLRHLSPEETGYYRRVAADLAADRDRGEEGGEDAHAAAAMVVSAFYGGGPSKYGNASESLAVYAEWMRNSIRIDAPYFVFGRYETLSLVKEARADCDWCGTSSRDRYMRLGWDEFASVRALRRLGYDPMGTTSVPQRIWSEKVAFLSRAAAVAPEYEWFAWVDIGVNNYRNDPPPAVPWPAPGALRRLPRSKIIVTFKAAKSGMDGVCGNWHEMMKTDRASCVAGTTFMVHREALALLVKVYYATFEDCVRDHNGPHNFCLDDQQILTKILIKHPEHFYAVGKGWAGVVADLYEPQGMGLDLSGIEYMTKAE